MLGVGWTEMLVIGVMALIVIGPKELPAVMQRIGRFAGTIRRMGQDFQRELNKTTGLNEITNLRNSVTAPLKATADAIRKEFNTVTPSGTVEPSGALKPADPKAESVVDEIRAKAGMLPLTKEKAAEMKAKEAADEAAAAASPAPAAVDPPVPTTPAPIVATAAPAKPRRTVRIKVPEPDTPKVEADLPPAKPRTRKTVAVAAPEAAETRAPEAVASAAPRRRATKAAAAEGATDSAAAAGSETPARKRTRKTTAPDKP